LCSGFSPKKRFIAFWKRTKAQTPERWSLRYWSTTRGAGKGMRGAWFNPLSGAKPASMQAGTMSFIRPAVARCEGSRKKPMRQLASVLVHLSRQYQLRIRSTAVD
jgi:hypothetical protein